MAAPLPPLADAADFRLGRWLVRPSIGEVIGAEGPQRLEPRVMRVLAALAEARDRTLSRDALMLAAWGGVISEDAVNRCIARLRALFDREGSVAILTVPKIGYRLTEIVAGEDPPPVRRDRRGAAPWLAACAALAVAAIGGMVLWSGRAEPALIPRPLTSDAGIEIFPALSPSGGQLVYAAHGPAGGPLNLKLLSVRDGQPIAFTSGPDFDLSPAWSPDGGRIAFARTDGFEPCRLMIKPAPAGSEREVGRCRATSHTTLAWGSGGHGLIYADAPGPGAATRLMRLDLDNGRTRALTAPPPSIAGDSDPAPSPDGRRLAFVRRAAPGADSILILDGERGAPRRVQGVEGAVRGLAWTSNDALLVSSDRDGGTGLWRIEVDGGPARPVASGLRHPVRLSAAGGRVVAEIESKQANLFVVAPAGWTPALPLSTATQWDPDMSPARTLAFISDRLGPTELFTASPGAPAQPATHFGGGFLQTPRWSPDGRSLVFVRAAGGLAQLWRVDPDGRNLKQLTHEGAEHREPAWTADGRRILFASDRRGGQWRIWSIDAGGGEARAESGPGWRAPRLSGDGRYLYAVRFGESGLWRRPAAGGDFVRLPARLNVIDAGAWAPDASGVVYVERQDWDRARLMRLSPDTGKTSVLGDASGLWMRSGLAVGPAGEVIVSLTTSSGVDLVTLERASR